MALEPHDNLPVQPTPFAGRQREVSFACELLSQVEVRLLTLIGPPGIGKTRLAIEVASRCTGEFTDGVFFVPLASISEPSLLTSAVAQTLGIRDDGALPLIENLKQLLRGRRTLLVLDNFEQIVEASTVVAELLSVCPGLKFLVTSREILHLRSEYEFTVPSLSVPDLRSAWDTRTAPEYEAIALFERRARAVDPDFELTSDNARTVAEICARLDGIPLAIELAAARVKVLSPEALLARISQRLQLLGNGPRDLPERHKTLHNAIQWSYELLDKSEQRLFAQLSVFAGGCTLNTAEAVCNAEGDMEISILEGITSLIDKSLLRRQQPTGGELRLVMLETIREYARDELEATPEGTEVHNRHAGYFLALAEEAWQHFFQQVQQPGWGQQDIEWVNRLEAEHDNMRAALHWYQTQVEAEAPGAQIEFVQKGLRLGASLLRLWFVRGYLTEGQEELALLLSKVPVPLPEGLPELEAAYQAALLVAGWLALFRGDNTHAHEYLEQSLAMASEMSDKPRLALALHCGGVLSTTEGSYATARLRLTASLDLFRELGNKWGVAVSLQNLGHLSLTEGSLAEAYPLLEQSLALFREIGDVFSLVSALSDTAFVAYLQREYSASLELWSESLRMSREIKFKSVTGEAQLGLGWTELRSGNLDEARRSFEDALSSSTELGDPSLAFSAVCGLGALAARLHEVEPAAWLFGAAQALRERMGINLSSARQDEVDSELAAARTELDGRQWATAWAEGYALLPDQLVPRAVQIAAQLPAVAQPDHAVQTGERRAPVPPYPDELTAREVEVLALLANGLSNAQMAERLYLSRRTIHAHLRSIYEKIQAHNRHAATRYAIEHGLV